MNQFDNITSYYSKDTVRKAILNSFVWMALGLLITGATSYFLYSSGLFLTILMSFPMIGIILLVGQIALAFGFMAAMQSSSATKIKVMFIVYALTMGFTMTSLAYQFALGTIAIAFGVSAFYFVCLVFIGMTTRKDLTSIGTICIVGLFALLISQLVMMLFRASMDVRLYSFIGLVLFTGITAWDVQRMGRVLTMSDGCPVEQEKMSVYFALELYLDFINIFLYILRILSSRSND